MTWRGQWRLATKPFQRDHSKGFRVGRARWLSVRRRIECRCWPSGGWNRVLINPLEQQPHSPVGRGNGQVSPRQSFRPLAKAYHAPPALASLTKRHLVDIDRYGNHCPGSLIAVKAGPPLVGCNVKGNISYSTGERIYHVPGQQYYNETRISLWKGERWFCSEQEARRLACRSQNNEEGRPIRRNKGLQSYLRRC